MKNIIHPRFKKVVYNALLLVIINVLCLISGQSTLPPLAFRESRPAITNLRFGDAIARAASDYDLNPALIAAVIQAESNFNPKAVSPAGAVGLMQIIPSKQRLLHLTRAFDPRSNIDAGSRYLKTLLDTFDGDISMALAAYNAGPGAVAKYDGIPPYRQTRDYVRRVLGFYKRFRQSFDWNIMIS